jgi:hypothetical protein
LPLSIYSPKELRIRAMKRIRLSKKRIKSKSLKCLQGAKKHIYFTKAYIIQELFGYYCVRKVFYP